MERIDRRNKIYELELDVIRLKKELQLKTNYLKKLVEEEKIDRSEVRLYSCHVIVLYIFLNSFRYKRIHIVTFWSQRRLYDIVDK